MKVPFFRPELSESEIAEVVETLRSGWLTTGPRTARFEREFAAAVGGDHAVALNSGTAALHLATVALGLGPGDVVLVPTMTFAATAEVVSYAGAIPLLVDCDAKRLNLDLEDAERRIADLRAGRLPFLPADAKVVGILPVHVGGLMVDMTAVRALAERHRLWVVEDAAHSFPAAYRDHDQTLRRAGEATSDVACFSFYANKTITTGEGGMAVTGNSELADQMRALSLHGLSTDAWGRYSEKGTWDYRILAPGYKYNLTDIASALGLHQLRRAEELRSARERIARRFRAELADLEAIELPEDPEDRLHSWHLFQIKLSERIGIDRDAFLAALREHGIGFSVHWRPLHLHPYYRDTFGWRPHDLPVASAVWSRTVSLPIFPAMRDDEVAAVIAAVRAICASHSAAPAAGR